MKRPNIPNWTSDAEAAELARLAPRCRVLEVGTFRGFGAVWMALNGATVWAVDWHRGDADLGELDTLTSWWTNVRRHHVEDQVVGLVGRSADVLPLLLPKSFDVAFVDAAHDLASVRADIAMVRPLLRAGGVLACHDYCAVWPGVVEAVDELVKTGEMALRCVDSLAILTAT